ncbi:hypothetical protein PC129_g10843 [Phytophthora cactorum]|uniref:DUF6818 domain-containing protein n=1 Tax=Phytophthora cactorum TaxID=29920 RepID=A0A329SP36_9STRA|nr:hypothetical protein PC112_g11874 [Phytophthora cactorum]KAG2855874.1 hypothetical protein PC113_g12082 [Phytophthora cactorum]KAG2903461.1 hypothetical protein PC114_g12249 [Phytophthora cactorum]KAG2935334.1 hypothetical protein PC117_g12445 [Phytophthora cactorum]KAG2939233.1 hypothetical protein PC115_g3241 [Phytophthora cactorum]
MVKSSGSTSYKLAKIDRLLDLVEDHFPLGKDEWERLSSPYNSSRPHGWAEREFESLRRKFKVLYSTRKPTGTATMPPHVSKANHLNKDIDEKAIIVEMDDEADEDLENEDQAADAPDGAPTYPPDLRFDFDAVESCCGSRESRRHENSHSTRDGDGDEFTVAANRSDGGSFQELLSMAMNGDGVDTFSTSAGLETLRTHPVTRSVRSVRLNKRSGAASPSAGTLSNATKVTSSTKKQKTVKKPAARGFNLGSRDEEEAMRYDALLDYSCRLGKSEL